MELQSLQPLLGRPVSALCASRHSSRGLPVPPAQPCKLASAPLQASPLSSAERRIRGAALLVSATAESSSLLVCLVYTLPPNLSSFESCLPSQSSVQHPCDTALNSANFSQTAGVIPVSVISPLLMHLPLVELHLCMLKGPPLSNIWRANRNAIAHVSSDAGRAQGGG